MEFLEQKTVAEVCAKRPLNVVQACLLQLLSVIMTAVTTMNGYNHYVETAAMLGREAGSFEQFLASRGISIVVSLMFAWMFYQGRNWARILYVAFFCINTVFILWSVSVLGGNKVLETLSSMDSLISLFQIVISLAICCLLMTKKTRVWFLEVKEARIYAASAQKDKNPS